MISTNLLSTNLLSTSPISTNLISTNQARVSAQGSTPLTVSASLAAPAKAPGRGEKAAREFEAQLIGSLLESLEKTFAAVPGDDAVPGSDDYNYLGTQALAQALADRGGFGIAAMISRHLAETPANPPHEGKSPAGDARPDAAGEAP